MLLNGEPVRGASVYVNTLVGEKLTTNAHGRVSFELTAGWAGFASIMIEGIPLVERAVSTILLEEGRNHDIRIVQP